MTSRSRFRTFLSLALTWGLLFALVAACTFEDGERASTGACPEDETCSDATPYGLTFFGPPAADDGEQQLLPRLAMGGAQNLSWGPAREGRHASLSLPTTAESTAPHFMTVQPADRERDAYALWTGEDDVRIDGITEGDAYLRVTHARTGELFDRIAIRVRRVASVDGVGIEGDAPALVPGRMATVIFRLFGESQMRLVDESMTIESETEFERASWDCIDFVVPDADDITFTLRAGHRHWALTLPIQR